MPFGLYVTSWLAFGFLVGAIPFGWIVTRINGVDIRKIGSGNIGMTNVWRALGWKYGVAVLILDTLKGVVPLVLLGLNLPDGPVAGNPGMAVWLKILTGLAAVLGHTFTPWLRFRGGKGVATAFGILIALYQLWVLVPAGIFVTLALATRYVSVGSLVAALSVAVMSFTVPQLKPLWPLGVLTVLLVFYTHRANIQRLLTGTENRIGMRKKSGNPAPTDESGK